VHVCVCVCVCVCFWGSNPGPRESSKRTLPLSRPQTNTKNLRLTSNGMYFWEIQGVVKQAVIDAFCLVVEY
jgi:hypothetical protein